MSDTRATDIIEAQSKLNADSANWTNLYQQVTERCWPGAADFNTKRSGGEGRMEKIFDATACLALDRSTAAISSTMIPDSQYWHGIKVGRDPEIMNYHPVRVWADQLRDVLFAVRNSVQSNFISQGQESVRSLLALGTQCMFTDDVAGRGIRYKSVHLSEVDFCESADGLVDKVYRKFEFTARQAMQQFDETKLPQKIRDCAEKNDVTTKFDFIHSVEPNGERDTRRKDYNNMPFKSCYVAVEGKCIVDDGGYRRMPYHISRYSTSPNETRGRGPAILLLPDIKMLNEIEKTTLRAGHLAVDPPLLLYEDGSLQSFQMRPRALNYGGVDEQGRQLVQPLKSGANLPWVMEMAESKRKFINEGFWLTLFQILVDNPRMTATEALLRAQEKGQLLASPIGRQQREWLGPMIRREIDILSEMDMIPPIPQELLAYLPVNYEDGTVDLAEALDIEYTSPISRLIRADDSVAVLRTFGQLAPMAQLDPTVYDVFDTDSVPRELANINGVPAKMLRSPQAVAKIRKDRQQAMQMEKILEAAPVAASAAKDLSMAAATAANVPQDMGMAA